MHEGCKKSSLSKTRSEWRLNKNPGNIENGRKNIEVLKMKGWDVKIVWTYELPPVNKKGTLDKLAEWFK